MIVKMPIGSEDLWESDECIDSLNNHFRRESHGCVGSRDSGAKNDRRPRRIGFKPKMRVLATLVKL